jgi:DNA-directed RNA polymerase specialized sigma24 family protein
VDGAEILVQRAIARDRAALRELVALVTPVVQARVARAVIARRAGQPPEVVRQEVEDLTQEVFVALFDDDARTLRAFRPERGLSLKNFVGLVAEHQVANIFRSGRRRPWQREPFVAADIDMLAAPVGGPESAALTKDLAEELLARLRTALSPLGLALFQRLLVDEEPVDAVATAMEMTIDAVYAWRSRLGRLVRAVATELLAESGDGRRGAPPASRGVEKEERP